VQRHDVYEAITDRVIAAIEDGAREWQMPWHRSGISRPPQRTYEEALSARQCSCALGRSRCVWLQLRVLVHV
jgi:hypothetical protein